MDVTWDILYRGPLDSCNYDCSYCPFAKRVNTRAQLDDDKLKLQRFITWVGEQTTRRIGVLFTPWGEALIHRHYQDAIVALSRMEQVYRVAIQTNLSGPLDWLIRADLSRAAFWATFHPSQVRLERFLQRCAELDAAGARYSVGIVGHRDHLDAMEQLRTALPTHVYLWVNAYKDEPRYYDEATIERIERIDPFFRVNLRGHPSRGRACAAGETSFAVDGEGNMTRCHFLPERIGNIYRDDVHAALRPRNCSRAHCTCHIGYVHLKELRLREIFGEGLLERIPLPGPWAEAQRGGQSRFNAARIAHV
jgi:sulfatase maturation enzyme AslB (radical SAM superfamily)